MNYSALILMALLLGYLLGRVVKVEKKIIERSIMVTTLLLILIIGSKFSASGAIAEGGTILRDSIIISLMASSFSVIVAILLLRIFGLGGGRT
ncbi:MAG: hypothetical protein J7J27_00070 [Euryarchaeota archaeon]|nr:hypothetical protein [Euryarchaeota archaeon]